MIVLDSILKELDKKKKLLEEKLEHKNIVDMLRDLFRTSIQEEANIHSCKIEYEKEEFRKACLNDLTNAQEWGLNNFDIEVGKDFILELTKKVEPWIVKEYRAYSIQISGALVQPPKASLVKPEIERFEKQMIYGRNKLKNGEISPVELAILAHYHLLRIHPFEDGNGRTSRLVQNLILHHSKFPPAMLYESEKSDYILHLRGADCAFKQRDSTDYWNNISDGEGNLYNYLASKVLLSLDLLIGGVYKK